MAAVSVTRASALRAGAPQPPALLRGFAAGEAITQLSWRICGCSLRGLEMIVMTPDRRRALV